jgi:ABC-type antimicrobial peptide transport system permease subunit
VLISERQLERRFSSVEGSRLLLVDAPAELVGGLRESLGLALGDLGLELRPPVERLAELYQVESTYLGIFLHLGALGLVIGTAGLMVVVAYDLGEQRGELALLRAVGFTRGQLTRILLVGHGIVLAAGVATGAVAALASVLPTLGEPGVHLPWRSLALAVLAVLATGVISIFSGIRHASGEDPAASLRQE